MKFLLTLCCMMGSLLLSAQSPENTDDGYFDPGRDPVARMVNGRLRLVVSEEVLVRSVAARLTRVGSIEQVDRRQFEDQWYLTLESRHAQDIEQSVFVAVRLMPRDDAEAYYADAYWTACTGEGCGSCGYAGYMKGCFCMFDKPGEPGTPGACYQTFSDEPLLQRVLLKLPK